MRSFTFTVCILISIFNASLAGAEPIKIGALLWLTSDFAMQSNALREGIELAVDETNAKGGLGGRRVEVIFENVTGPASSASGFQKLKSVDRVSALLLQAYDDVMVNKESISAAKVPTICLWDANPEIDAASPYVFSIGPWNPSAGEVSAAFAVHTLKAKSAIIIHHTDVWSEGAAEYFEVSFKRHGGKILTKVALNPDDSDFRAVLSRVRAAAPDVMYTPVDYQIVPFYKQVKALGVTMPVISSDIITREHLVQAQQAFDGVYQSSIEDPAPARYQQLEARYQKKFGKPITLPWFVTTGFDGVMLLVEGLKSGGEDRGAVGNFLLNSKSISGLSRDFKFNGGRSAPSYEVMYRIQNGKFVKLDQ